MGNTPSSGIPTPTNATLDNFDEKAKELHELDVSLSQLQVTVPLSSSGQLTLDHVSSWETAAAGDPKVQLARTILTHSDIRSALSSRSAKIADQHVFNNVIDFKTGPITNQKSSGRCWLFATTNVLRYNIMKKFKLTDFQLSQVGVHLLWGRI
jgi:bleomycin hydrolase